MGSGLSLSSRNWYVEQIMKVLRKYGKASVPLILAEMRRNPQRRLPIQEERVVAFLKYLKALGIITYSKSLKRKIPSKWIYDSENKKNLKWEVQ